MRLDTLLHASFRVHSGPVGLVGCLVQPVLGVFLQVFESTAHTQAKTIHSILSDTRGELKRYHQQLTEAIDRAIDRGRKKNLKVIGCEGGFTVTSDVPPEGRAKADSDNQGDITALFDEVQGILDKATQSDDSASTVLKAIADQTELGFSDANYSDRDSAAAAVKAAKDLARLAKKDPDDLTVKDFDTLNDGLKKYADDGLFGETFATTLGPKKTLEFWTGVTGANRGNLTLAQGRCSGQRQPRFSGIRPVTS